MGVTRLEPAPRQAQTQTMRRPSKPAKKAQVVKENAEEDTPQRHLYGRHTKPDTRSWLLIDAHGISQVTPYIGLPQPVP